MVYLTAPKDPQTKPKLLFFLHGCYTHTETDLAGVVTTKCIHCHDNLHAMADDITEVISTSQSSFADWNWEKWDKFCRDVDLNPLLILYRDPVPIPTPPPQEITNRRNQPQRVSSISQNY